MRAGSAEGVVNHSVRKTVCQILLKNPKETVCIGSSERPGIVEPRTRTGCVSVQFDCHSELGIDR